MRLGDDSTHLTWDNSLAAALTVAPGDTLEIDVLNAAGRQLGRDATVGDILTMDFAQVNPVTGPIVVDGVSPEDTLVIDIVDIAVHDWGWTAIIPGFGLLADDFPDAHLRMSSVQDGIVTFDGGGLPSLPAVPMVGTIGLAPSERGALPMVPPHRRGGNMDIRHITAGTRLRLPVGVDGGMLSMGDTHAAMGDGEVCGTGVEIGSTVTVRVDVERNLAVPTAVLETDGCAARSGPSLITTGIHADIWAAARDATRSMIDQIVRRTKLDPRDAYLLTSVAADMHISEIVDLPNVVVSMHLPMALLDGV